jgi:hypothetical protein
MKQLHIVIAISLIFASLRWGDWKNWERYYPTMLYLALSCTIYEFISHQYFHLWEIEPHYLTNETVTHILHSVLIYPLSAYLFLSNYSEGKWTKQIIYITKWVILFIGIEWILTILKIISHVNGWTLGWSLFFDIVMFLMLRLHYVKPKLALLLSIFWTFFYLFKFNYI